MCVFVWLSTFPVELAPPMHRALGLGSFKPRLVGMMPVTSKFPLRCELHWAELDLTRREDRKLTQGKECKAEFRS